MPTKVAPKFSITAILFPTEARKRLEMITHTYARSEDQLEGHYAHIATLRGRRESGNRCTCWPSTEDNIS